MSTEVRCHRAIWGIVEHEDGTLRRGWSCSCHGIVAGPAAPPDLASQNERQIRLEAAEARVAELTALLEQRSEGHLAEIERTQERCNQEAAVHRHEAQQAAQQAGELRGEVRDLRARVAQLEAEAAAAGKQAAQLAADALRAEREAEGGRLIADGWRIVAEARADTPRRWERTP